MTTRLLTLTVTIGVAAVLLAGCGPLPSGPRTSQDRDVATVTAVDLRTSGTLVVEHGTPTSLTVTAPDSLVDNLTSEVENGVLVLAHDGTWRLWGGAGRIEYRLVTAEIDALAVRGSGAVEAAGVTGDSVAITVEGSGSVELTGVEARDLLVRVVGSGRVSPNGSVVEQSVSVQGSGSYRAQGLTSEQARVAVQGSGGANVEVTGTLDASVVGSGSVVHGGGAEVSTDVKGSGSVRAR